ncbi:hypothetical protein LRS11_10840 [Pseudomonas sp. J452]|uniref:virulence factor TspB C-terminal domain-related protein n=1 Tax=Pseudomonas sp. J452 TaxID=2898441 RepID=UPI0021AD627F|nr:virulence factor TspB C-terminal domain-related protein [Pseudomonas sp. J452]UUY10485.1 hypothetical protein LRS11_10840 [Pseudomonas sp. J452]
MHRLLLRLGSLVALCLLSATASADFTYSLAHRPDIYFATAQAACDAAIPDVQAHPNAQTPPVTVVAAHPYSGDSVCVFDVRRNSDNQMYTYQGYPCRAEGSCPLIKESCEAGDTQSLTWPLGREEVAVGDSSFTPFGYDLPPAYCFSGCLGNLDAQGTGQDFFGQPDTDPKYEVIFANVAYNLSGAACSSGSNEPVPDIPPPPEPDPCEVNPTGEGCTPPPDPCIANPSAEGCTPPPDPCVADPNAAGCPGGDGGDGGDTGGGDTGGGDTGGGDTGGGDTGGGDTGGGDSGGDTGTVSGMECNVGLACSGDAIQCATLRFQKDEYCADQKAMDYPSQEGDIKDFLNQPEFKAVADEEVDLGSMFSEGTRFLPSGCPSPESVALTSAGGRTFQFSYEPLCQLATDLSYLIVAAAGIFFAVYVGRAAGG